MSIEKKYHQMIAWLKAIGPLKGHFQLCPIEGHLEYDVFKLWAGYDVCRGDVIHYSTSSHGDCRIDDSCNNYEEDVEYLYKQVAPLFCDNNLF